MEGVLHALPPNLPLASGSVAPPHHPLRVVRARPTKEVGPWRGPLLCEELEVRGWSTRSGPPGGLRAGRVSDSHRYRILRN